MNTNIWNFFIPFHYTLFILPKLQNLLTKSYIALKWNSNDVLFIPTVLRWDNWTQGGENYFLIILSSFNKSCLEGSLSIATTQSYWCNSLASYENDNQTTEIIMTNKDI